MFKKSILGSEGKLECELRPCCCNRQHAIARPLNLSRQTPLDSKLHAQMNSITFCSDKHFQFAQHPIDVFRLVVCEHYGP